MPGRLEPQRSVYILFQIIHLIQRNNWKREVKNCADMIQFVECLPTTNKALGFILSTISTTCGYMPVILAFRK